MQDPFELGNATEMAGFSGRARLAERSGAAAIALAGALR